jgi:hypothetical protein
MEPTILSQLGRVVYWATMGIAILAAVGVVILSVANVAEVYETSGEVLSLIIFGGVIIWAIGRGVRYILANE